MTTANSQDVMLHNLLENQIEPFLNHLRSAGYAERTLRKKRTVARAFIRWTRVEEIKLHELSESHVAAFLGRSPWKSKSHMKLERSVMRLLLQYLHQNVSVFGSPLPPGRSPVDELVDRYVNYLRKDRGLAENSILVYAPFVRGLLRDQLDVSVKAFDAATIQSFLLSQIRDRSSEYKRLLATALRSFFRFLFLCGDLPTDLSSSVPTVRKCQKPAIPAFLSQEETDRVIAAMDQSTATFGLGVRAPFRCLATTMRIKNTPRTRVSAEKGAFANRNPPASASGTPPSANQRQRGSRPASG